MKALIKINSENADRPTVLGRELHKALEVKTPYKKWFDRMCEYGFTEKSDFVTVDKNVLRSDGAEMPQIQYDHQLTLDMAKEICMLQRSEKGKMFRQYFIDVEKQWNSPEAVMARALQMANKQLDTLTAENVKLSRTLAIQNQQISELKAKADYYDIILQNKGLVTITQIAKDYGMSGNKMNEKLHELGVQYKQSSQWLLYAKYQSKGYTHSETVEIVRSNGMPDVKMNTKWTQKGRLFLYTLLKKNGVIPCIEQ